MNKIGLSQNSSDIFDPEGNQNREFHHHFSPEIIGKYDIRGIVNDTLFELDAYAVGLAFAQTLIRSGGKTVSVCYDGRHSSVKLEKMLVQGLCDGGAFVSRIGLGPTPMLYYSVHQLSMDAGIMVTGSHNAPDYNGFKFTLKDRPFFGEDLEKLAIEAVRGLHRKVPGKIREVDLKASYIGRLYRTYQGNKALSVVWDPGNGAAGEIVQELVSVLPGNHYVINGDIDGDFPNHHPDPTVPANLEQLKKTVTSYGCDLGIAFDGDGDRIGAVDKTGKIIPADKLLTLFSQDILTRHPDAIFIADVKTSQTYFDRINGLGGNAIMWNTGHSLIKTKMIETGALLAGEMSGHIFFADSYYGFDDALYAAVRLLSLLSTGTKSFEHMCNALPASYATPEIRIPCDESQKSFIMEQIENSVSSSDGEISTIDGVRVRNDNGWWLVRSSNTEPVLVARCEAWSADALKNLVMQLKNLVEHHGLELDQSYLMEGENNA